MKGKFSHRLFFRQHFAYLLASEKKKLRRILPQFVDFFFFSLDSFFVSHFGRRKKDFIGTYFLIRPPERGKYAGSFLVGEWYQVNRPIPTEGLFLPLLFAGTEGREGGAAQQAATPPNPPPPPPFRLRGKKSDTIRPHPPSYGSERTLKRIPDGVSMDVS